MKGAAMIRNFANKETEHIWHGLRSRKLPPDIQKRALDKRLMCICSDKQL